MNIQEHMDRWIEHLSVPQENLGNMPICPYAKSAKYKLIYADLDNIEIPAIDFELVIFVLPEYITEDELHNVCKSYNELYENYIFLPDPKDRVTIIAGIQTNNGQYNLILCQPKDKLLKARQSLANTKYYTYWSADYLKEITGMEL